jgi:thiol-disulfide isomerase/thioredoxin
MKNILFLSLFIFVCCLLIFCSFFLSRQTNQQYTPNTADNSRKTINQTVQHYWDNLNVTDTATLFRKEASEQQLVDYLYLLNKASADSAHSGLITLLDKTLINQAIFNHFIGLIEKYLYYPDSPLRNEELYINVLEYYLQDRRLDAEYKLRPQYQLSMLYKNRVAHAAEDFNYITPSGDKGSLYSINAPFTLLLFYDPDCENCREIIRELSDNTMLKSMQQGKELQVLAIYTAGNVKLWQDYASSMPAEWVNGYDKQQINKQQKYDLRAFPTLYLLDKDKKVLLKDAYMDVVLDSLNMVAHKNLIIN